jgi:hypothetical protein
MGKFKEFISRLKFDSYSIIIPRYVYNEYVNNKPKIKKKLNKIIRKYQLELCEIKNSVTELKHLEIDLGEADAFMQIHKLKKMKSNSKIRFLFVTNDKKAIRYFSSSAINTCTLSDVLNKHILFSNKLLN